MQFEAPFGHTVVAKNAMSAAGPHFCAGEDLRRLPVEGFGLKKGSRLPQSVRIRGSSRTLDTLDRLLLYADKTTVVVCQGGVIGAGMHLALTADIRMATVRSSCSHSCSSRAWPMRCSTSS